MDLDELLTGSAPPVAERTPELTHELRMLVVTTHVSRRSRRRRRALLAGVSVIAAGVVGWGAADAAGLTGGREFPWTDPAGSACTLGFAVGPASYDFGAEPGSLPKHIDPAVQQKAVGDARRFLASFDLASVDEKSAVAKYQAIQDRIAARGMDPDPATGDDLIMASVGHLFGQELSAYLREHGDNPALVGISFSGTGDACFDDLPGAVGRG